MKKIFFLILLVPLFGLNILGDDSVSVATDDFGFDFVGTMSDLSERWFKPKFMLISEQGTVWERFIPGSIVSNGVFKVRLSDRSGYSTETWPNLASVVEKAGTGRLILDVREADKIIGAELPPVQIAGVAERALGASGNFNAAKGLVVPTMTAGDVSAGKVIAESISSRTAVKTSDALTVKGNLQASGSLLSQGQVTAKTMTVKGDVAVTSTLEAKKELSVGTAKEIKTLTVGKSLNVAGINVAVPEGTIVAWNDAKNIPAGWTICNGENGTPDMRTRFVVGGGNGYVPGDQQKGYGGSDSVQLTMNQMPSHNHRLPYYTGMIKAERYRSSAEVRGISDVYKDEQTRTIDTACGPTSGSSTLGKAHENRPPYYALVFIMKKYGGAK